MSKADAYHDKVRDWMLTEAQDEAYGLPVRPFPLPEFNPLPEPDENGRELPDRTNPVTPPLFTREVSADGQTWVIRTPRKVAGVKQSLRGKRNDDQPLIVADAGGS